MYDSAKHVRAVRKAVDSAISVKGFFTRSELSYAARITAYAVSSGAPPNVVEIGSYKGRSSSMFGTVLKEVRPDDGKLWCIDPFMGSMSSGQYQPSFEWWKQTMNDRGLLGLTTPIKERSECVRWPVSRPIRVLLIDARHEKAAALGDFDNFAPHVEPEGFVAFHDIGVTRWPGLKSLVKELCEEERLVPMGQADTLFVGAMPGSNHPKCLRNPVYWER